MNIKKYYLRSALKMNTITKLLIGVFFGIMFSYLWVKFWKTHNFDIGRWPIYSKQAPTRKEEPKKSIILPSLTPTPKPKAQTYYIKSFPKYLTDQGAINRMNILAMAKEKYQGDDLISLDNIIKKESGYRPEALNEIGAGGICQAYPYTKMNCPLSQDGLNCQLDWCINYINNRYGSPTKAWNFHQVNNYF